jgi:antitoxin component YwqK of YwqJK toxin-antitoxin module
MKRIIVLLLLLVQLNLFAQERTVKEIISVRNPAKMSYANGVASVIGETQPFTGTYYKLDFDSTVLKTVQYKKGKIDGKSVDYFKGGKVIQYERSYSAGLLTSQKEYFNDGSLREERAYNASGKPHGEWKKYNYGNLVSSIKYDNGKQLN